MQNGEKAFEEKSKNEIPAIKSADTKERALVTYSSEVIGFGRWPSGTIIGSGEERVEADGRAVSEWRGLWSTREGDIIKWTGSDRSSGPGETDRGVMLMRLQTTSEKLKWMNEVVVVEEHAGTAHAFPGVAYEWNGGGDTQ